MKAFAESLFEVMQVYEFQQKRILLNKFVESQFKLMQVYEIQTKGNS